MKNIEYKPSEELYKEAVDYNNFRINCKSYLRKNGIDYDKFTMVDHDTIIGFVSEVIVCNYIRKTYPRTTVITWDSQFDLEKINELVKTNSTKTENVEYVKSYFYDRWDLKLRNNDKSIYVDVKSSSTAKSPAVFWNFLYPKVQVEKKGKDGVILGYCVLTNTKDIRTFQRFILVGFVSLNTVSKCKLQPKGTRTRFGTISQIDNYITELNRDYSDINQILK